MRVYDKLSTSDTVVTITGGEGQAGDSDKQQQQYSRDVLTGDGVGEVQSNEGGEGGKCPFAITPYQAAFEPVIFSLRLFGLFFDRPPKTSLSRGLPTAGELYCWTITIGAWINVVFCVTTIRKVTVFGRELIMILAATACFSLVALNATGMLRSSLNAKNRMKFFHGFEKLHEYGGSLTDPKALRAFCTKVNIGFWVAWLLDVTIINYGIFTTNAYNVLLLNYGDVATDADGSGRALLILKIVHAFITCYMTALLLLPTCFELCFGRLLYTEFTLFRRHLAAKLMTSQRRLVSQFETDRKRYLAMTKIVTAADYTMSVHHGAAFGCDLGSICLLLYTLAYLPPPTTTVAATYVFFMFASFLDMAAVCVVGILVNAAARRVGDRLHDIHAVGVTNDFTLQVTLFLRNIDEYFGLSVCRLFSIDRPVILSLAGMLVTYFLVIVQFASASSVLSAQYSATINSTLIYPDTWQH